MRNLLVGIDEAGRGPLAGPVAVGVAITTGDFDWSLLPEVNDSKQMTEAARERVFKQAIELRRKGLLNYSVHQVAASVIDAKGISFAIKAAMSRGLNKLAVSAETEIRLDGSLRAPDTFHNQTTIIKGDATEPIISLASVMAKVTRDRYMKRLASSYPEYELEIHKGYGTKKHRESIKKHGLTIIHRKSFCSNLLT